MIAQHNNNASPMNWWPVELTPHRPCHSPEKDQQAVTTAQYRKACEKLGLTTVRETADKLGISPAMAQRYAVGRWPPSQTVAKLLRAMVKLGTTDV